MLHVDRVLLLLHQLPLGTLTVLLGPTLCVQVELVPRESLHLETIQVLHLLLVDSHGSPDATREMVRVVELVSWRPRVLTDLSLHLLIRIR